MTSSDLTVSCIRQYGTKLIAALPEVSPDGNHAQVFQDLLRRLEGSDTVLFADIRPGDLDHFFHLRLAQILQERPPLAALSVVVVRPEPTAPPLAGGFVDRFRSAWPFARCVFVSESDCTASLSDQLGVPVGRLDDSEKTPAILHTEAQADQKIALQLQTVWGRCGSTTLFENQIEGLVRAGFFTIRLLSNPQLRHGATLTEDLKQIVPENSTNAGAHVTLPAVPDGPPFHSVTDEPNQQWASWLAAAASCRIRDTAAAEAARRADTVIANHIDTVGTAIHLAPTARLLLDVHDDQAAATRAWLVRAGKGKAEIEAGVEAAARAQAAVLSIPDICTHVNTVEMAQLGPKSQRCALVLPRLYVRRAPASGSAQFDVLVVGDEHPANIASLQWFLDEVWRPHLEPAKLSVAIVGRASRHIDRAAYVSASLHIMGFVDDLDAVRSACSVTAVPDRSGTGISVKMLAALAAEHPLVTTSVGVRGLDPAIAGLLMARDDPTEFAADIIALLRDPDRLAERRHLVSRVQKAIHRGPSHADLVRCLPLPDERAVAERRVRWARVIAALPPDPLPYRFELDQNFSMSGSAADPQVLIDGWHAAEPWGRWTDGAVASLLVTLAAPTDDPLKLELDISPSPVGALLALRIDEMTFPPLQPQAGPNIWEIPPQVTRGKNSFLVTLHVSETVCPSKSGASSDGRILGIGVAALRVRSHQTIECAFGEYLPVNQDIRWREVLRTGWHVLEPWGCWTSGTMASLQLTVGEPSQGSIRLELDVVSTPVVATLILSVNGWTAPPRPLGSGINRWDLPAKAREGHTQFWVTLSVSETFCPAEANGSADTRVLGVGLRGIRLSRFELPVIAVGTPLSLAAPTELDGILLRGWHKPEAWGCWTSGLEAEFCLPFDQPLAGSYRLELHLSLPPVCPALTVVVNGRALPAVIPVNGCNAWILPNECVNGQQDIVIGLHVTGTFCPSEHGKTADDRILGIGVRSVGLHQRRAQETTEGH